jgi:hypothetical protein
MLGNVAGKLRLILRRFEKRFDVRIIISLGASQNRTPSAGTSKSHTHGQFKTAHLGLVVRARVGYLESVAFRYRAVTLD